MRQPMYLAARSIAFASSSAALESLSAPPTCSASTLQQPGQLPPPPGAGAGSVKGERADEATAAASLGSRRCSTFAAPAARWAGPGGAGRSGPGWGTRTSRRHAARAVQHSEDGKCKCQGGYAAGLVWAGGLVAHHLSSLYRPRRAGRASGALSYRAAAGARNGSEPFRRQHLDLFGARKPVEAVHTAGRHAGAARYAAEDAKYGLWGLARAAAPQPSRRRLSSSRKEIQLVWA